MLNKLRKPVIGVLLISPPRFRDLGEGTEHGAYCERKEKEAAQIIGRMSFAEIVFPGVVYTREDMAAAMKAYADAGIDMVFAGFLSWSDDFAWIRFLRDMPEIPVYFVGISREEPGFDDSLDEDRFVEFLSAGGLVGTLEASGSARRFARPMMRMKTGSMDEIMAETELMARASALRRVLKDAVFGLLPSYNEVMWSTYVDPYALFMKAGPELRFLKVAELSRYVKAVSEERTREAMRAIQAVYPCRGEINAEKMLASVEASLAVEDMARSYGTELLVLNDIDPILMSELGLRPGFTPCPGTKDIMVVPEGDVGAGLACYILGKLTGGHVGYIEPFYVDRRIGAFAAGHAGPNDYTDPGGVTVLSTDARFAKSNFKHAGAPFAWHVFSPGMKTMLHVSQCGEGFKMACAVVTSLETEHFLAGYTHGVFKSGRPAEEFFTELQRIGVTQHYAIADGDHTRQLAAVAELLGFEFYEIS